MSLTSPQLVTLRALLDRLVPADDFPGALAAGTDHFIVALLDGDAADEAPGIALGLDQLDAEAVARHGAEGTFGSLTAGQQDALLLALERGETATPWPAPLVATAFFNRMVTLAAEGFYADPANGGNRDAASWRMVGYDPRLPPHPSAP